MTSPSDETPFGTYSHGLRLGGRIKRTLPDLTIRGTAPRGTPTKPSEGTLLVGGDVVGRRNVTTE
jgi:hypothetical protein